MRQLFRTSVLALTTLAATGALADPGVIGGIGPAPGDGAGYDHGPGRGPGRDGPGRGGPGHGGPGRGGPGRPGPGPGPGGPGGPGGYCQNNPYITLRQQYYGDQYLDLRQLLRIGRECQGAIVQQVIVTASSQDGRSTAALYANNQANGQYIAQGYPRQYSFFPNAYGNRLDYDIRTLGLRLTGNLYVESIQVVMDNGYNPPPPPPPRQLRRVDLGVSGFAGQGVQTSYLNVNPQVGYMEAVEFYSHYAATNVQQVVVVFSDGEVVAYPGMIIQQGGTGRIDLYRRRNRQVGGYVQQIQVTAGTASLPAYGVHLQTYGLVQY